MSEDRWTDQQREQATKFMERLNEAGLTMGIKPHQIVVDGVNAIKAALVSLSRAYNPKKRNWKYIDLWCELNRRIAYIFGTDWMPQESAYERQRSPYTAIVIGSEPIVLFGEMEIDPNLTTEEMYKKAFNISEECGYNTIRVSHRVIRVYDNDGPRYFDLEYEMPPLPTKLAPGHVRCPRLSEITEWRRAEVWMR